MKRTILLSALYIILSSTIAFGQGGYSSNVKPEVISGEPQFDKFFTTSNLKKISDVKTVLVIGFGVGLNTELNVGLRSGGVKPKDSDARMNVTFRLMNADKVMLQSATDELFAYFTEKIKAAGYEIKPFEAYQAIMDKHENAKAEPDKDPKLLRFSANNMPVYIISMKSVKPLKEVDKEINNDASMYMNLPLNFMEYYAATTSANIKFEPKPQFYFSGAQLFCNAFPATVAYVSEKDYGYCFGKDFIKEIKEGADTNPHQHYEDKVNEVYVDNDKFKAALLELGKSYIDNMVKGLKQK